ncbi:MAG: glycosyltransferase [Paracoccus sp. (in: a-proteobacteria)]|uniref:glycosyltransferase family 32 protein n=1 Tax=Paracoccus sp. TaxID=267 RepID=UPI0026E02A48|nr:glycosyltransferase [Paracoccus sp. (in: a-proteobacteria)]MDO5631979.1 glycosyltransferase [Paracoccus sp. (in: a-proteobacteria)]
MRVVVHPGLHQCGTAFLHETLRTIPEPLPKGWINARHDARLRPVFRRLADDLANFATTGRPRKRAGAQAALRDLLQQAGDLGAQVLFLSDDGFLGCPPAAYIATGQPPRFYPRAAEVAEIFDAALSGHERCYLFTLRSHQDVLRRQYLDAIGQIRFDMSLPDYIDRLAGQGLAEYRFDRVIADWARYSGTGRIALLHHDLLDRNPDAYLRTLERFLTLPARLLRVPDGWAEARLTPGQIALARSLFEPGQSNQDIRRKREQVAACPTGPTAPPQEKPTAAQMRQMRDSFAGDLGNGAGPYRHLTPPGDIPPDLRELNAHFRIGGLADARADGRNIVYFWDAALKMPRAFYNNVAHCAAQQPDWQVMLLHDADAPALLDGLDPVLAQTYPQIRPPAARSDILRLAFLFKHGGWYIDADSSPVIPLDDFNLSGPVMFHRDDMSRGPRFCANHCLYFDAGHQIPGLCLQRIAENIACKTHLYDVEAFSGPALLTQVLTELDYPADALYPYSRYFVQKEPLYFRSLRLPGSTSWSMEQFFGVLDDLPPDFGGLPLRLSPRTSAQLMVMLDRHPDPGILAEIARIRPRFLKDGPFRQRYETVFGPIG